MDPSTLSDFELFQQVAVGISASSPTVPAADSKAGFPYPDKYLWDAFIKRFAKLCFHAINRVIDRHSVLNREDGSEIFQLFFIHLLERDRALLRRYRGENGCTPSTYLAHIAAYQALECARERERQVRNLRRDETKKFYEKQIESPEREATDAQRRVAVYRLVSLLSPSDRQLFHLHYEQGLSLTEIAEKTQRTLSAVHVQHFRLKERFRSALEQSSTPPELYSE